MSARLSRARQNIAVLRALVGTERFWEIAEAVERIARAHPDPDALALACVMLEAEALGASEKEAVEVRWRAIRETPMWVPPGTPSDPLAPTRLPRKGGGAAKAKHSIQGGNEVDNRSKVEAALEAGPLTYAQLRQRSGVPVGSYDRVLTTLSADGTITKTDGIYALADGSYALADGEDAVPQGDADKVPAFNPATYRGSWAYCAACGGAHPKPREHDNAHGMTYELAHAEGIVA